MVREYIRLKRMVIHSTSKFTQGTMDQAARADPCHFFVQFEDALNYSVITQFCFTLTNMTSIHLPALNMYLDCTARDSSF